jgi:hypothetical protein
MRQQRKSGRERQPVLPFPEAGELPRAFWQARFCDFNVYSKGEKTEKLNHMHANPVTRGLVEHPDLAMEPVVALWERRDGLVHLDDVECKETLRSLLASIHPSRKSFGSATYGKDCP